MFPPLLAQKFVLLEGHSAPLESNFASKPKPNAKLRLFIQQVNGLAKFFVYIASGVRVDMQSLLALEHLLTDYCYICLNNMLFLQKIHKQNRMEVKAMAR